MVFEPRCRRADPGGCAALGGPPAISPHLGVGVNAGRVVFVTGGRRGADSSDVRHEVGRRRYPARREQAR